MDIENCTKEECQECETEIKEVSAEEAVCEVSAPAVCMLPKEDFEVLKNGFKSYYDALLRLIKTTKEKDTTIAKITKELQKHREGNVYEKHANNVKNNNFFACHGTFADDLYECICFSKQRRNFAPYARGERFEELYFLFGIGGTFKFTVR